jgi:N-acetylmuramoyl-L-alanine amidase
MSSFKYLLFFAIAGLLFVLPSPAVFAQNSNWEEKLHARARKMADDIEFVRLEEVAEVLSASTYYSNKVRKAILYLGEEKITVAAYNPFVVVGQEILQMPIDTRYDGGDILLPVKFFVPIVKDVLRGTGDLANAETNIAGLSVEEKANGTLIRILTRKDFPPASISTRFSRGWLYVDLLEGKIDPKALKPELGKGLVKKIVPVQLEQMVQLSFQLAKDISVKDLQITQQGGEIWIAIPNNEKLGSDIIAKLKNNREKWKIDKIVIDPGHGGRDPGARGRGNTREKDVVLDIAKKLKKIFEKKSDVQVFMTRETDEYISLKDRTQFANKKEGKLFISIHANWNRNSQVSGATTYFLGLAKSEEALDIAQRENEVIKYEGNGDDSNYSNEMKILATMAQNDYNKESQELAAMIQKDMEQHSGLADRGVKQAGFYVMVGASMPNVLVETAFLSNPREEKLLKSSSFQQKVAEAIFESVMRFKEKYEVELAANK